MASGDGTSENKTSPALESLSGPEENRNPKIPSTLKDVAQDLTPLSKGKQVVLDSKYGHDSIDQNKQSSTSTSIPSSPGGSGIFPSRRDEEHIIALGPSSSSKKRLIRALQEADSQTDGPHLVQSNLGGVAASVAPTTATIVDPNVGSVVAHLGEASLEPNGGALIVLNDVDRAQPIVVLHGGAPALSNVAFLVAPSSEDLAQPNIVSNVAPPTPAVVASCIAPCHVAPIQPDVSPHVQQNGAPAPMQPNAAIIVAPPVVVVDGNRGLNRSRLKPLRICEIGSEGHMWPKLP